MPRLEIKKMKGNSVPHKKAAAKSDISAAPGKSGIMSSRAQKEKCAKDTETRKELDRLFALGTTRDDSNSGSEEGLEEDSGEGSASDEGEENVSDEDTRNDKRNDRSKPAGEDDGDVEVEHKGQRRGHDQRKPQGGVKSKRVPAKKNKEPRALRQLRALDVKDSLKIRQANQTEPIYQATCILVRNITEHCNPHCLLIDGLVMTNLGDDGSKPSEMHEQFNEMILSEMLWLQVCQWLPQVEEFAAEIAFDSNLVCQISDYISGVAKKTRSDDLPRVKGAIIELLDIKDADHVLHDKTAQGFNNVATACLLCPVSDIDEFDEDPSQ
ncbi:hypothetical protein V8D89_010033 [Ganoderma adspersum]